MFKKIKKLFSKKFFHFREIFNSFDEAQKFLKNKNEEYSYNDVRSYDKLLSLNDSEAHERFAAPVIIIPLLKKKLKVLDVGGGNYPIYNIIKKATNISVHCSVLETKRFLDSIKWRINKKHKKYLKYFSELNQLKHNIDIVYFNSSIQYLKDYEDFLLQCIKFKPNFFFINRTIFHNKKNFFFFIDHTIPNTSHPITILSVIKLIKFFKKNKYSLIFQNKYNKNLYSHNTLGKNALFMKDLVFEKIS